MNCLIGGASVVLCEHNLLTCLCCARAHPVIVTTNGVVYDPSPFSPSTGAVMAIWSGRETGVWMWICALA